MIDSGQNRALTYKMADYTLTRDYEGKRVNPPYRPYIQGNPCYVISRHGTQFFRGCYSRDAWTTEATFSVKTTWTKFLFRFRFINVLGTVSRLFVRPGFRLFCARLAVHYLAVYSVLGSLIFNGNEYNGCVSVRYNSLFISLPL